MFFILQSKFCITIIKTQFLVTWRKLQSNPYKDCIEGWIKIGTASNLEEAKTLMLNNTRCAKEGAILYYSGHSYDPLWGVRCATSEMITMTRCKNSDPIWTEYQLSFKNSLSGEYHNYCHTLHCTCSIFIRVRVYL